MATNKSTLPSATWKHSKRENEQVKSATISRTANLKTKKLIINSCSVVVVVLLLSKRAEQTKPISACWIQYYIVVVCWQFQSRSRVECSENRATCFVCCSIFLLWALFANHKHTRSVRKALSASWLLRDVTICNFSIKTCQSNFSQPDFSNG